MKEHSHGTWTGVNKRNYTKKQSMYVPTERSAGEIESSEAWIVPRGPPSVRGDLAPPSSLVPRVFQATWVSILTSAVCRPVCMPASAAAFLLTALPLSLNEGSKEFSRDPLSLT